MIFTMYPTYDHCDPQGFFDDGPDHVMLPYLTIADQPVPVISDEFRPHTASTAAGKSPCFSALPDAATNEWRRKNQQDWSATDVFHWIASVATQNHFSYEDVNATAFNVDGSTLLKFSRQDFEIRDHQYGGLLYNALHGGSYTSDFQSLTSETYNTVETPDEGYSFPLHNSQNVPDSESGPSDSEPDPPPKKIKRPPGRPPGAKSKAKAEKKTGRLWEFIRNLLHNPDTCPSVICWEDHDEGVFRFVKSEKVAKIWGKRKNNEKMNYEKLSRAMRYYYKSQVLLPVLGRKLVYKFGPNAKGWRSDNPNFRLPTPESSF